MAYKFVGMPIASASQPRAPAVRSRYSFRLSDGEQRRQSCAKEGVVITEHEAEKVKRIYREANREIVQLWNTLEAAAIRALRDPGTWFYVANERIGFVKEDAWLYLRLPSGRCLTYVNPKYEQVDPAVGPRWRPP
jgi:hypothetical protein